MPLQEEKPIGQGTRHPRAGRMDGRFQRAGPGSLEGHQATMHYPHYRLASGTMHIWEGADMDDAYLYRVRAGLGQIGWHHSVWTRREVVHCSDEKDPMIYETTYSNARAHLASLMDQVTDTREPILIRRRGAEPVALVAADELAGWMETAYLLRSPRNAQRLVGRQPPCRRRGRHTAEYRTTPRTTRPRRHVREAAAGMRSSTRTVCTTWSTGSLPAGGARFASSN